MGSYCSCFGRFKNGNNMHDVVDYYKYYNFDNLENHDYDNLLILYASLDSISE